MEVEGMTEGVTGGGMGSFVQAGEGGQCQGALGM